MCFFFFKQKTAYEMRISDWSSDVCSSDLVIEGAAALADYDAIIIGAPTRFGRMPSQMAAFLDTAGGLWASGKLNGKVGGAFTSTATQHGGQEMTLFSIITNLLHFGLSVVRSEEHTSELTSLMHLSYAVVCLKKKNNKK